MNQLWIILGFMVFLLSGCNQALAAQLAPTPEPTPVVVDAGGTLMALLEETEQMAQGMVLIGESLPDDEYVAGEWQTDLQRGIDGLLQAHANIVSMQRPQELQELHTLVLDSSVACTQTAHLLAEALRQQEDGNYQAAKPHLEACEQGYSVLVHALEAALDAHW